jgi:tripartite-type tricarboxylate transporter receptor subunit TctC
VLRLRFWRGGHLLSILGAPTLSAGIIAPRWRPRKRSKRMGGLIMTLPRRRFLRLTAGAAALTATGRGARADAYPVRPVRWLVGYAPGGGNDITARLMGQFLSERLGQQFVVENRPGAATNVATEAVVNAPSDGYTLLLVGLPNASNATFFPKLNFDFIRDIAPVAGMVRVPNALVVHPSVPATTVPELIAYAKANPGKVDMASAGTGGGSHLTGALFNVLAGTELVHVPYRGNGPALAAILAGEVQVLFPSAPSAISYIRAGSLRGLAVTTATRSPALPDLPTVGDFVPGYEMSVWYGVGAPHGTPPAVIETLNQAVNAGLADPTLKARFEDLAGIPIGGSPADFGRLIADETAKWAKVIRAADIKPD